MITRRVASSLGLMSHLGAARTVAVRGVVAGATERVPVIPITYELKGRAPSFRINLDTRMEAVGVKASG
jgi:hypothetical protein